MSHDALLEIGTEEIPAKKVNNIHQNLKKLTENILNENRISSEKIKVIGAPRRLVVLIENIAETQEELIEEIKGPPCNIAFDDEGNPTRAAKGFAESQNISVEDLKKRDTEKGEYLFRRYSLLIIRWYP